MSEKVKLRYVGPHRAVELQDSDGSWHVVEQGEEKEFPANVADSLLAQVDNWEPVGRKGPAAKKSEEGNK